MKNRFSLGLSLFALVSVLIVNGCKTTATDPAYVALAEIRFADYHQVEPIQIFVYPPNASHSDSAAWTSPMTYGIITPYFTNIPTGRTAGETYHLAAYDVLHKVFIAHEDVTLKPGDKYTWLISGISGTFDSTLINDAIPSHQGNSLANFRFLNVVPSPPGSTLSLRVGDPLNGMLIGTEPYRGISQYVGIPFGQDTSITFFVVDQSGTVLGLLSGVGVDTGGYHTVTWGGQDPRYRIHDPNGNPLLSDTVRIRIWDDNLGTDLYGGSVPQSFRYNLINALIPPAYPNATLFDYTTAGGLAIVIDNNTAYDYNHILPDSLAPKEFIWDPKNPNVAFQVPTVISPYNPGTDKLYFNMVEPKGSTPSTADPILFRFFAGLTGSNGLLKSDQQYTIIVFDTVKKPLSLESAGYDSSGGVATIPIPVMPVANSAIIIFGNMLAPVKGSQTPNKAKFTLTGVTKTNKVSAPKSYDSAMVAPGPITIDASINAGANAKDFKFSFTPEAGGIYEVFLVGKQDYPNPLLYQPHWIAVRVNPIRQ